MRFRGRSFNRGRMFGALQVASETRALAVMLGGMEGPRWPEDCLARFLVEGVGALGGSLDDDAPARLAEIFLARLGEDGEERPSWLLFAAALARPGAVEVCHAGDLRVQLQREGAVTQSTIDHTLFNSVPPDQAALLGPAQKNVVARSLARGAEAPARATWPLARPARLVIASSEVHRYRDGAVAWPEPFNYSAGAFIEVDCEV